MSDPVYSFDAATLDLLEPDVRAAVELLFDEQEKKKAQALRDSELAYQAELARTLLGSGRGWSEIVPCDDETEEDSLYSSIFLSDDELAHGKVIFVERDGSPLRCDPPSMTMSAFYRDLYRFDLSKHAGWHEDEKGNRRFDYVDYEPILVNHRNREHPYRLYKSVPSLIKGVQDETSFIYMGSFWVPSNGFLTARRNAMTTINGFCVDLDRVEDDKGRHFNADWVMSTLIQKLDEAPDALMPNYLMLSGTGIQLWYVFMDRIPLLSAKKRKLADGRVLNASPRRDKYQRVLKELYAYFDRVLPKNRFRVDIPCATISHPFRAPASPSKHLFPTRLFVLNGWRRTPCNPLAISDVLGCDLEPYDLEDWDQEEYRRIADEHGRDRRTRTSPATDKQISWLTKLSAMGCVSHVPCDMTIADADALIKRGEIVYTRRQQRRAGEGIIETTSGHCVPTRPRDPGLYRYTLHRLSTETPAGSRYNALFGLAGLGWNCGIPKAQVERDMMSLLGTEWASKLGHDGKPLEKADVRAAMRGWNPLGALRPREQLESRLQWKYGPSAKRNGRRRADHLAQVARPVRKAYIEAGRKDVSGGGRPTKEKEIKAYAAAHPNANHSEIARALGVSRPTVIKWLKDRGQAGGSVHAE